MIKTQYRVTNTTIKAPKVVNGVDTRKIIEKVGYSVQYYDSEGVLQVLPPGHSRVTQTINDGMINFKDLGLLKIEEISNVANLLKDHTDKPRKKTSRVKNAKNQGSNEKV